MTHSLTKLVAVMALSSCLGAGMVHASPISTDDNRITSETFANPLFRNGADPWLEYFNGNYYLTTTTWTSELVMRKSPTIAGLADAPAHNIWTGTDKSRCCNFWAFEFHPMQTADGLRWYVIYTSGVAENFDGQRNHILESEGSDPMGPYTYKGTPMPDHWNIDGSYLEYKGQLYFLWSEWHGKDQVNLIAKMSNPWTIEGEHKVITQPTYAWEKSGLNVNEGPEIIQHQGRTFLVHSASFCNTEDYSLGVVELTGTDPMDPAAWTKYDKPFFSKANGVYGPGHHGFFTSPDGSEDWLVYHGNSSPTDGCSGTRSARAQPFKWDDKGLPNFGEPMADKQPLRVPSGEFGPLKAQVEGMKYRIVNHDTDQCLITNAKGDVSVSRCDDKASTWVIDPTNDGLYRFANVAEGSFLTQENCQDSEALGVSAAPWVASRCQRWSVDASHDGWFHFANERSIQNLQAANCSTQKGAAVVTGENRVSDCTDWRIEPVSHLAIVNAHSGRVVSAQQCDVKANANVVQHEYTANACQQWQATSTSDGYYRLQSKQLTANKQAQCLVSVDGNLQLGGCEQADSEWRTEFMPNGSLRVVSRKGGSSMKVAGESYANGDNIVEDVWKNTISQQFYFREVK
ncbi:family 43 glycosylhydrolase [Shewanella baltica]|uniref:family 43 glycosylhydrolase n=1 Tax=Shewanella baltica TaxID=62322 RepID=UPI00216A347B|nr:family 43 glycosylhydrolase [Shewanella baltica]MCS6113271.1 family 43 glycosylhydrolase [Shewanella baltica]UVW64025.1 family 43 glycosylhydrolase [Shewanella baltica]